MKKVLFFPLAIAIYCLSACETPKDELVQPAKTYLQLNYGVTTVGRNLGDRSHFDVLSDTTWKLEIKPASADWLGFSKTTGKGSSSVELIALKANENIQRREAEVIASLLHDTTIKVKMVVYQHDSTARD